MPDETIGILHPGEMGITLAATIRNSGYPVFWASEGRSPQTRQRAERLDLEDLGSLQKLCETCSILVSICPPAAAEDLAHQVRLANFPGLYLDANAISPQKARRIASIIAGNGASFVDGSIIGPPALQPDTTWLYLSGEQASRLAACFLAGPLQARLLGDAPGAASALKMCYAAYTKGTTALLSAILAAAESFDVRQALTDQWALDDPDFSERTSHRIGRSAKKAWRFIGEMEEIASTFESAGLPGGFHRAAAEIYQRTARYKDQPAPTLEEILQAVLGNVPR